tara:strand:+ start:187408 stop:187620 length:213 start_codon:yes stop_codon:yes gene_type:complete
MAPSLAITRQIHFVAFMPFVVNTFFNTKRKVCKFFLLNHPIVPKERSLTAAKRNLQVFTSPGASNPYFWA